ncbi:MAG: hypothetical protein K2X77_11550, partial [Candidatus Obscuribacterales bacterium]|nr:hypothetical protein [Candidatus Obscuribacterales bacterium]
PPPLSVFSGNSDSAPPENSLNPFAPSTIECFFRQLLGRAITKLIASCAKPGVTPENSPSE